MRPKSTPNDPGRRERLIDCAIHLIQENGIAAVTARSVANRAGVPVSSVAYYFDSVRALLLDAARRVLRLRSDTLTRWLRAAGPDTVLVRLAELIHHQLTEQRATSVVAYELYLLGMRDEAFRGVSEMSIVHLRDRLAELLPSAAASRLAATADGYQLQCLFERATPSVEHIHGLLVTES